MEEMPDTAAQRFDSTLRVPRAESVADAAVSFTWGTAADPCAGRGHRQGRRPWPQSIALPLLLLNRLQVVGDQHGLATRDLLSVGRLPFLPGKHLPPHRHV